MEIKTYNLYKAVKKTARENNLLPVEYGNNVLLDASILADIDIDDEYRDAIIGNIQKYHIYHDRMGVFIVIYDKFVTFEVRAFFANHRIYNEKTGKKLYVISQITAVKVTKIQYLNIWNDSREIQEITKHTYYNEPIADIEI